MGRKGENKRTKRSMAPSFWAIHRKNHQFTVTTAPGPHLKSESYPLAVLIRDILKVVNTYREAQNVIRAGKILVDGVVRLKSDFAVGLMDIINIPLLGKDYRMVPLERTLLVPLQIPESEKNLKIVKVKSKTTVRGGKIQYGLHDGRSILTESEIATNIGDSFLLEVPSQKIIRTIAMKNNVLALVVKGRRAGKIGRIKEIRPGTFTRRKMVDMEIEGEITELPAEMVITIGNEEPFVTLSGGS
jgi:small subunit ribosomal protein S4e